MLKALPGKLLFLVFLVNEGFYCQASRDLASERLRASSSHPGALPPAALLLATTCSIRRVTLAQEQGGGDASRSVLASL